MAVLADVDRMPPMYDINMNMNLSDRGFCSHLTALYLCNCAIVQ